VDIFLTTQRSPNFICHAMTCQHCKAQIRISRRPGRFLAIAIALGLAATVVGIAFSTAASVVLAFASLISFCGVWTEMTDASAPVYSKFRRQGVECPSCDHISPIRPWSL